MRSLYTLDRPVLCAGPPIFLFRRFYLNHLMGFGVCHVDPASIDLLSQPMVVYIDMLKFRLQFRYFFGDETDGLDVITLHFDTMIIRLNFQITSWYKPGSFSCR